MISFSGLELDFKKPDEVPDYILGKLKEREAAGSSKTPPEPVPGSSQIASASKRPCQNYIWSVCVAVMLITQFNTRPNFGTA